jgi:glycosyltransferase involved in cell wall biosynthesis
MIAFHFPPCRESSGIQRTLKFSRYLPENNWKPIILAPKKSAYPNLGDDLLKEIHPEAIVRRTWAIDSSRHLAIRGIYFNALTVPDRWTSWLLSAVPVGLGLIKKYKPDLIWSTYPIATTQLIGLCLNRITHVPWVADFRDPMLYESWPERNSVRKVHNAIERQVVKHAEKIVVTTPSTKSLYLDRYKAVATDKWEIINNGYDEENFKAFDRGANHKRNDKQSIVLVHSGLMEPQDRDPSTFFKVLSVLCEEGVISGDDLKIVLRATGMDELYEKQISQYNIAHIVQLAPSIAYQDALAEMHNADGLLLFQGATCNRQIPAKAYEYIRSHKPIFAMADPQGDTAELMSECGVKTVAPLDSFNGIKSEFSRFLQMLRTDSYVPIKKSIVDRYSRRTQTVQLAKLFETVVTGT